MFCRYEGLNWVQKSLLWSSPIFLKNLCTIKTLLIYVDFLHMFLVFTNFMIHGFWDTQVFLRNQKQRNSRPCCISIFSFLPWNSNKWEWYKRYPLNQLIKMARSPDHWGPENSKVINCGKNSLLVNLGDTAHCSQSSTSYSRAKGYWVQCK